MLKIALNFKYTGCGNKITPLRKGAQLYSHLSRITHTYKFCGAANFTSFGQFSFNSVTGQKSYPVSSKATLKCKVNNVVELRFSNYTLAK